MNSSTGLFSLADRRALITGSSRGIGRALALAFARAGADVAVHGWNDRLQAEETASGIRAFGRRTCVIQADLGAGEGTHAVHREAVAGLGGAPDILVCNASIQEPAEWEDITREQFDRQVAVNLRSTFELCQLTAPAMLQQHWGRILMIGSVQERRPHPQMAVYAATKAAQSSLMNNLARQLARDGVTVNNLAPGVILTDRNSGRLEDSAYAATVRAAIPLGYFGETADCTGPALLLCSDAGRYITGQSLYVDGGLSL